MTADEVITRLKAMVPAPDGTYTFSDAFVTEVAETFGQLEGEALRAYMLALIGACPKREDQERLNMFNNVLALKPVFIASMQRFRLWKAEGQKTAVVVGIEKIRSMSDYDITCRHCAHVYNGRGINNCPKCGMPGQLQDHPEWAR